MKTPHLLVRALCLAWPFLLASSGFSQGALSPPPGAPAPTMKTLDQVEARTIVNATNTPGDAANTYIITAPGSYYLTGNITGASGKHGIAVVASNVTLDLNGFALISGGGGATRGVNTSTPVSGFCIRNGSVSGWSDGGVRADFAVTLTEKLLLANNVGGTGLIVGNGSMVTDCVASGNATGFFCPDRTQISNCIATVNTGVGFDCTSYVNLIDCTSSRNGGTGIVALGSCSIIRCSATRNLPAGVGIRAGTDCTIVDCTVSNNGLDGIAVESGTTVRDCMATGNGRDGISVTSRCLVTGNTCSLNSSGPGPPDAGIRISGNSNRIDENSSNSNSDYGIYVVDGTAGNLIIRNISGGHPTVGFVSWNYRLVIGTNGIAPVVQAAGDISAASPWANFNY